MTAAGRLAAILTDVVGYSRLTGRTRRARRERREAARLIRFNAQGSFPQTANPPPRSGMTG